MSLINIRELLAFPQGDNSSDTLIGGIHWNLTTLGHWNYTYYSNGTFSNGSNCFIIFEPYTPSLLENGTFVNSTSCYSPIEPLGLRSKIGLGFAVFFAISIMFTFVNLRKHGRLFLPVEKRFRPVGRRWQWYWMLMVAAFGLIAGITNVDVDRYFLPQLPLVLANFFWYLCLPTTMAVVWESVRHWGSWQERQMVDPNPFSLKQNDKRARVELLIPLVFYFFFWLNFFMVVPQAWGNIEMQRDPDQAQLIAEPTATNIRFKLGAFFLFAGWLTTVFSLHHSIHHYKPRNRGLFNRIIGLIRYIPPKFILTLLLSLVLIGYEAACAFDFDISPLKLHTNIGMIYGLGWGPIVLIFIVYEIAGYFDPNEDRELIRQRRVRGADIDREMGITKKPNWWNRLQGDSYLNVHDRIAKNVSEIGGGAATTKNLESAIEMRSMTTKQNEPKKRDPVISGTSVLFPGSSGTTLNTPFSDNPPRGRNPGAAPESRTPLANRSDSSNSGVSITANPQKIRSMLDV